MRQLKDIQVVFRRGGEDEKMHKGMTKWQKFWGGITGSDTSRRLIEIGLRALKEDQEKALSWLR